MEITRISFGADKGDLVRVTMVDYPGGRTDYTFRGSSVRVWNERLGGRGPFETKPRNGIVVGPSMCTVSFMGGSFAMVVPGQETATVEFSAETANNLVEDLFAAVGTLDLQHHTTFKGLDPERDFVIRDGGRRTLRRGPEGWEKTHRRPGNEQQLVVNGHTPAPPGS